MAGPDFNPRDFGARRRIRPLSNPFVVARPVPWGVRLSFWITIGQFAWGIVWQALNYPDSWGRTANVLLAVVGTLLLLSIFAALVALAFLVLHGRNWARIVTTVFAAIGVVQVVVQLAIGVDSPISDYASDALSVGEVVLLWLPTSNQYFRDSKRLRAERKAQRLSTPIWKPIP